MTFWRRERPDIHTLVAPYALNALDEAERAAVERHLRVCPSCAIDVEELRNTATSLSFPAMAQPGQHVREQVLAQIRRTAQVPPAVPEPKTQPKTAPARRFLRPQLVAFATVVVLFALVLSLLVFDRGSDNNPGRNDASAVLLAGDAVSTSISAGGNTMTVISSRKSDAGVVVMAKPPELPAGQTYQLWYLKDGKARSAGLMGNGDTTRLIRGVGDATQLGVTVEPESGSAQPSTAPLFSVGL